MPEPTPLDSRDALLRLLTLRGVGSAGQVLGDRIGPTAGAQDLTEALRWAGIPARVVEAGAVALLDLKTHPAAGNSLGLIPHGGHRRSAN